MTCYKFECTHWWKINLKNFFLQDLLSSLNDVISTNNESTEFITGHVIYNPAYTYNKFQLKTTIGSQQPTYFSNCRMKKKQKPFHVNLWKWTLGAYIAFETIPILLQQKYWVGGFEKKANFADIHSLYICLQELWIISFSLVNMTEKSQLFLAF